MKQEKKLAVEEAAQRIKQIKETAKTAIPTAKSETITVHESKHFPFQIIEITTTDNETGSSEQKFKIGMCSQFVSNKEFALKEKAEKYISSRPWDLITGMVCVTIKNAFDYEKSKSNN